MQTDQSTEYIDTVVIGGGQAGLAAGYELARRGRPFVILDAHARTGDAWRTRWDSLRLFTPRRDCALPGMKLTGSQSLAPTKDEMGDYLEAYAAHHALPVRHNVQVTRLSKTNETFRIETATGDLTAANVVVATGSYAEPKVPAFAADLDPHIVAMHSMDYRNPAQLQPGGVLLVGAGNSAADIGLEVAQTHPTWMAGKHPGHIPPDIDKWFARTVVVRIVRFIQHQVLCLRTPIGRKASAGGPRTTPLVRVKPKWLADAGVVRTGRVTGAQDGLPMLEDGQVLDVTNVIWCTGFRHGFPWIDLPGGFDDIGRPLHTRGVSDTVPGLYFLGLPFQFSLTSATLWGINRDAAHVGKALARRPVTTAGEVYATAA